jgi:SAM-dependent methyltransferase
MTASPRSPRANKPRAGVSAAQLRQLEARMRQRGSRALYESGPFYDHLYRRRRADVQFYVEVARAARGPVLELGVGTGRVAFALAQAGIDVVGIDTMPSMLGHARRNAQRLPKASAARVELRRGDLRTLRLGRRFPLIIAPFNAFSHLYTRADVELALATCRAHLRPRGQLVFDVTLPDLRALTQDPARVFRYGIVADPRDGRRYVQYEASHYDPTEQIRNMTLLFERVDAPEQRTALPLMHRQFFPAELEALLHYNGFAIEQRYGDFTRGPLTSHSESQVIIARPSRSRRARTSSRA